MEPRFDLLMGAYGYPQYTRRLDVLCKPEGIPMPRLIPRLLKVLSKDHQNTRERIVTLPRTRTGRPTSVPTPNVPTHHGRKRSVLLDDVNPITNAPAYRRRKTRDPRVITSSIHVAESAGPQYDDESSYEPRRVMSEEERRWWANPYRTS